MPDSLMNKCNKKGAVLPFVIIIGTALLLLCSALLLLVNYGIQSLKNSQGYAQGYINARSAISFAQGILAADAKAGNLRSFYIAGVKSASGAMDYSANYDTLPGNTDSVYATCTYTSETGQIEVIGFIKTPDYFKYKDIRFATFYSKGQGTQTAVDTTTTPILQNAFGTVTIDKEYVEIFANINTNDRPNNKINIITNVIQIGNSTPDLNISIHTNSNFKLISKSGLSYVPVIVKTPLTITYSKSGKKATSIFIEAGHYHFASGSEITNSRAWGPNLLPDQGLDHIPSTQGAGSTGGFLGGAFH